MASIASILAVLFILNPPHAAARVQPTHYSCNDTAAIHPTQVVSGSSFVGTPLTHASATWLSTGSTLRSIQASPTDGLSGIFGSGYESEVGSASADDLGPSATAISLEIDRQDASPLDSFPDEIFGFGSELEPIGLDSLQSEPHPLATAVSPGLSARSALTSGGFPDGFRRGFPDGFSGSFGPPAIAVPPSLPQQSDFSATTSQSDCSTTTTRVSTSTKSITTSAKKSSSSADKSSATTTSRSDRDSTTIGTSSWTTTITLNLTKFECSGTPAITPPLTRELPTPTNLTAKKLIVSAPSLVTSTVWSVTTFCPPLLARDAPKTFPTDVATSPPKGFPGLVPDGIPAISPPSSGLDRVELGSLSNPPDPPASAPLLDLPQQNDLSVGSSQSDCSSTITRISTSTETITTTTTRSRLIADKSSVTTTWVPSPDFIPAEVTTSTNCITASPITSPLATKTVYTTTTVCPPSARDAPNPPPADVALLTSCLLSDACQPFLAHTRACFEALAPWTDPYNDTQSTIFQVCLCQTTPSTPFDSSSPFWASYTESAKCLYKAGVDTSLLANESGEINNFCHSQHPSTYLFILRLQAWLAQLTHGNTLAFDPIEGPITDFVPSPQWTSTPPLANLAYGASAPAGGSLVGVAPSLTTYTTTEVVGMAPDVTKVGTVTELVTWVPTASASTGSFDASAAGSSAMSSNEVALASQLATEAKSGIACASKGLCVTAGAARSSDIRTILASCAAILSVLLTVLL